MSVYFSSHSPWLKLFLPALISSTLLTAEETPLTIEEIVVTSDFHQSSALDIASSISVIDEQRILDSGAEHLEQLLSLAPNINFSSGASRGRFIQIRGIGERAEFVQPVNYSVGVAIDGIDFTGISTAATTLDIRQVEILRGPQGTLYGANALAGLINLVSNGPTAEFEGDVEATLGNFDTRVVKAAAGGPANEALGYRVAVQQTHSNGFVDNSFLGRDDTSDIDETSARLRLFWAADADTEIDLTLFLADIDNGYDAFSFENNRITRSDQPGADEQKTRAIAITGQHQLSDALQLKGTLSHAQSDNLYSYDEDWSFVDLCNQVACPFGDYSSFDSYSRDNDNTSLDLRLISDATETAAWVAGLYHRDQRIDLVRDYTFLANPFTSSYDTSNTALYGEVSWPLTDSLKLSTGLRLERRDADYGDNSGFQFNTDETLWGGRIALSWRLNEDQQLYALVSRGYKPGGSNPSNAIPSDLRQFETESLLNYELGLKGLWLDNRLQAQISLFYQDRDDIQTDNSLVTCATGGFPCRFDDYINNAAAGANYGLESEFTLQVNDQLRLFFSLGLLETEFEDFVSFTHINADETSGTGVNLDGREQAHAPSYTFVAGANIQLSHQLVLNLNIQGKDDFFFSDSHEERSDSYELLNARLTYEREHWSLALWGRNLGDRDFQTRGFGSFGNDPRNGFATQPYFQLGEPRTFGLTGRYVF